MPGKAADLRRKLADWRRDVGARMPTPNPAYEPEKDPKRAGAPPMQPLAAAPGFWEE